MIFTRKTTSTSQSKLTDCYKTLDFVKVWNYYKVEETGDFRYLLKLKDYESLPEYDTSGLELIYNDLKTEVDQIAINKNRKSQVVFEKRKKYHELQNNYNIIQLTIDILYLDKDVKYIKLLSDYGFKINKNNGYYKELGRIRKSSGILITRIGILGEEIERMTNVASTNNATAWDEIESVGAYLKEPINVHELDMTMYLIKKYKVLEAINKDQK